MTTHPLYAAIDAAIAEHGWPDEAWSMYLNKHNRRCVNAMGAGQPDGWGETMVDAHRMALEAKSRVEQARADDEARRALLAFCEQQNINPGLVRA